jgi:hypothetical protein
MWALVVAGQILGVFNSQADCLRAASLHHKRPEACQPMAAAPLAPPNDGGWSQYQQCVQVGACKPF